MCFKELKKKQNKTKKQYFESLKKKTNFIFKPVEVAHCSHIQYESLAGWHEWGWQ